MNAPQDLRLRTNPFATRYTRPGQVDFLFPAGQSAVSLVDTLASGGWWGEIVGPHGSGKSTLLAALTPEVASRGRHIVPYCLHEGERKLPLLADRCDAWSQQTQVVIDGYEQLSWWSRRSLQSLCRRRGAGLLITAHTSCGLPPLFQTAPSLDLAQSVVGRLLPPGDTTISAADVAAEFHRHPGNLRELLFRLYDLYQSRLAS